MFFPLFAHFFSFSPIFYHSLSFLLNTIFSLSLFSCKTLCFSISLSFYSLLSISPWPLCTITIFLFLFYLRLFGFVYSILISLSFCKLSLSVCFSFRHFQLFVKHISLFLSLFSQELFRHFLSLSQFSLLPFFLFYFNILSLFSFYMFSP